MNNDTLQKGIENIKSIKMSENEKAEMLKSLSVYINKPVLNTVKSPSPYFGIFSFTAHRSFVMASILVLIFGVGGTAVFASQGSLPGDLLYTLKVKVTEPVVGAVTFNKNAKINWEAQKANRRLKEAERLAENARLNSGLVQEIESLFSEHTDKFNKLAEEEDNRIKVEESSNDDVEKINNSRIDFESDVSKHTDNLEKMKEGLSSEKRVEVDSLREAVLKKMKNKKEMKEERRENNNLNDIQN